MHVEICRIRGGKGTTEKSRDEKEEEESERKREREKVEGGTWHVQATCVGYVSRKWPKNRIRPGSTI